MGLRSCDSNTTVPRVDDILTARFLWQSTSSKQECTQTTYNTKIPIGSTRRLFCSLVLLPILQTRAAPSFGLDAIHSQLETWPSSLEIGDTSDEVIFIHFHVLRY